MTETELQRSIKQALELLGFWVVRMGVSMKRGPRGTQAGEPSMPDLLVLNPLQFLEVKLPGGVLSDVQETWHARAKEAGLPVRVVESARESCLLMLERRTEQEHRDRMGWERTATG